MSEAETQSLHLELPPDPALGRTEVTSFELRHVNVVMGPNGSGKSRLLQSLVQAKGPKRWFIDGSHFIDLSDSPLQKPNRVKGVKTSAMQQRIFSALLQLGSKDDARFATYGEACKRYRRDGGEQPTMPASALGEFFTVFNAVLPHLRLSTTDQKKTIVCHRGRARFDLKELSDGERRVFLLIADVLFALPSKLKAIVLVDEPERGLHPALACRLWSSLEGSRPEAVFLYATHDTRFATRSDVDLLYFLDNEGKPIALTDVSEAPARIRSELLYQLEHRPNLLLFCERERGGLDQVAYESLLGGAESLSVLPLGTRSETEKWMKRRSGFEALPGIEGIAAIVDRDCSPDEQLARLESVGLVVLPLHEIESLFVTVPMIGTLLDVGEKQAIKLLMEAAQATINVALAKWAAVAPGKAASEKKGAGLRRVRDMLDDVLERQDVEGVLRLFPGKELCRHLYSDGWEQIVLSAAAGSSWHSLREAQSVLESVQSTLGISPSVGGE